MNITRHEMGPRFSEMSVAQVGTVNMIYISGQVAEHTSMDITGQTREILLYIDRLLAHVGANKTNIVSARVYLASVGDYAAMNSVWDDWVPQGHTPARTTVGAKMPDPEYKVLIEVTAIADRVTADESCEKGDHHAHSHNYPSQHH
ncbi:MAG: RidA family protein [Gammaproteobacteria bacterium]|nr:RidA family protein [Gammaproteobacteria bacterium]